MGLDWVLFILSYEEEVVQKVIAVLSCCEDEARPHYVDRVACLDSIKVLNCNSMYLLLCELKSDLVQISQLTLEKKEKCAFDNQNRVAGEEKTLVFKLIISPWHCALSVFVVSFLVADKVLTDNDDSTWAKWIRRHLDQHVSFFIDRGAVLPHDMIKSEIHLIESQSLLNLTSDHCGIVAISFSIINFKTSELWVLDAYIYSNHVKSDCVRFVSFQRT